MTKSVASIEDMLGDLPVPSPTKEDKTASPVEGQDSQVSTSVGAPQVEVPQVEVPVNEASVDKTGAMTTTDLKASSTMWEGAKKNPPGTGKSWEKLKNVEKKKRKAANPKEMARKKIQTEKAVSDEVRMPSLLGDIVVPYYKVPEGEISISKSIFRPEVGMSINDRLTVDSAPDFVYNCIPPRDRRVLRGADITSVRQRLALGAAQVMCLAAELIDRDEGAEEELEKLAAKKEKCEDDLKVVTSSLEAEKKISSERQQSIDLLQSDLKASRTSVGELEQKYKNAAARIAFLEGEGASQIISSFLASELGTKTLANLCGPARNLGYHRALEALGPKCPEVDMTQERGYNVKAEAAFKRAFEDLKLVVVDGKPFVPPTSEAAEEEKE